MLLYRQVLHALKDKILNGEYAAGSRLPKQDDLAKEFETSRMTIQKAINALKAENLVYAKKGSGTFVVDEVSANFYLDNVDEYFGFSENYKGFGEVSSEVISFHIRQPTEFEQMKLEIGPTKEVYDIIRLRYLNGEPLRLEYTIMPVELIPGLSEDIMYESIYRYIKEDLGLSIGDAFRKIAAYKPDAYDQKYLGCQVDDPVLEVEQQVYLSTGELFEYSQTRHRYDKGYYIFSNVT